MSFRVVEVSCPGCGAPWASSQRVCEYCGRSVVVTSLADLSGLTAVDLRKASRTLGDAVEHGSDDPLVRLALGATFLKLGQCERAGAQFDRVIDEAPGESEAYFYAALAELGGRKPFLLTLPTVRKVERYLETALQLDPRGAYWLLRGYIATDYYERKGLRGAWPSMNCLAESRAAGLSFSDAQEVAALANASESIYFTPFT